MVSKNTPKLISDTSISSAKFVSRSGSRYDQRRRDGGRRRYTLVDRYDLRAADSFPLTAPLEACEYALEDRAFLTADQKLDAA
jgi:hypothetical protein